MAFTSPDTKTGGHNGSATTTELRVTLPALATVKEYVTRSPAAATDETDGVLVTVSLAAAATGTDTDWASDTATPCGSVAVAVAVLLITPASRSV